MKTNKKKMIDFITDLNSELMKVHINIERLNDIKKNIENIQLLVSVIGAFSTGKSTLINSFIGKDILPVGITPETALATEIRFSEDEFIYAFKESGEFDKYSLNDFELIKTKVIHYSFLRLYINNINVKNIEPLILVDMPGFNSPFDIHNKAIMNYLDKAVHFIVLINSDAGTLTKQIIRQLADIKEYERGLSFFLSKANLRSDSDIQAIIQTISEQLKDELDIDQVIEPIGKGGGQNLSKIVNSIDPDRLIYSIFCPVLKSIYFDADNQLNIKISTLSKSAREIEDAVKELELRQINLENKKRGLIEELKSKYSDNSVVRIINSVAIDISNQVDSLVAIAMKSGSEIFSKELNEIIRHRLIAEVKTSFSEIQEDILREFVFSLKMVNTNLDSFAINENVVGKISSFIKDGVLSLTSTTESFLDTKVKEKKGNMKDFYKVISTVIAVTTSVINPILEIIIIFIPDIIGFLFKNIQEKRKMEELRNEILIKIIPDLKRELSLKLPEIFSINIKKLIDNISEQFESELKKFQETILLQKKDMEDKKLNIEQELTLFNAVKNSITEKANAILFL